MKSRTFLFAALVAFAALVSPRLAIAQLGMPGGGVGGHSDNPNGPTVSPYLNLLQTNSQGFTPYQTMVKPVIDQQNAIQRQGDAIQRLQQQTSSRTPGSGRSTGHQTYFNNYSHFYPRRR